MKKRVLIFAASLGFAVASAHATTNSWISSNGGKWETGARWLLGTPDISQDAEVITNGTSKTVTIDDTTVSTTPTSLTIKNLIISGPLNTTNTLFLNNAGTNGLRVANDLSTANNGVLQFALGTNRSPVAVSSNLTLGSTLNITNGGGFTTTTYTLFTYGGTLSTNGFVIGTTPNTSFTYSVTASATQLLLTVSSGSASSAGARFTASPTSGAQPLLVTFTDISTGSPPLSLSWNLGDSTTTNTAGGASFTHSYTAGTYSVTLTASNFVGSSTLVSNNLIVVALLTPFQTWQTSYFGSTNNPNAALGADPDGDGQSNSSEFLGGTNPTNNTSAFQITSEVRQGTNVVVTWQGTGGTTNILQVATGGPNGGYTNNFVDLSTRIFLAGSGDVTTNFIHVGGASSLTSRYYRVRMVPQNEAADDASTYGGWATGNNGGYGFSAWTLTTSSNDASVNGYFIGSSTNNGSPPHPAPGIDIGVKSWGTYANTGNNTAAFRSFSGGSLAVGQTFLLSMDNGNIASGQKVGFTIRNGNATSSPADYNTGARLEFMFVGGTNNYQVVDSAGQHFTTVPFTATGLRLSFTLTGTDTYSLVVVNNANGTNTTITGTLAGSGALDSFCLYNRNAGSGGNNDAFFNSLQLTGMPAP